MPPKLRTTALKLTLASGAVFLVSSILIQPAEACRKYSRWHYPWPQSCRTLKFAALALIPKRPPERQLPAPLPPEHEFLIPDMSSIEWGQTLDERTIGLIRLRAELEK